MKRLLVILLLIPGLAFGAYTEFYCQSGGSNLNAGSTTSNTALYTSTNGGWNSGTKVFTPTDGINPVSAGVAVGMWASAYVDGASVGVYIGRISAVTNAVNGTITADLVPIGTAPSTLASARSLKVGGAWLGPNAASGFPFTLTSFGVNKNSSVQAVRTNLKNDQTYSLTASFSFATSGSQNVVQGYTSTVGDSGIATFDGSTSTGAIIADVGTTGTAFINVKFKTSITTGTTDLVTTIRASEFIRCVFTGSRRRAILTNTGAAVSVLESEFYDCNKSNTASAGILEFQGPGSVYRSIFHDNPGSNVAAVRIGTTGPIDIQHSVFSGIGKHGVQIVATSSIGQINLDSDDFYNNGSDAINNDSTSIAPVWIENCNFIKNGGKGINNANSTTGFFGYVYNCGYGSGTQANGSTDTLNNFIRDGTDVTYASGVTPWTDQANGNFSNNVAAAQGAGRGAFTETAPAYAGTVGYPDITAAQALPGCTFPTPTATPTASATATFTPTPTATFTPTITPCAPTPTATATWTPTPTFTPTATATNTPTPTATATSTPTPTPTPSATSTPTATACAGGEVSYNHSD